MIIKTYEEKYLDEIILMIKECILEINQEDYSQKQVSVWADIDLDEFKESIPKNAQFILTHESKDAIAKNKHKYKKSDIKLINNFDIDRYVTLDVEEKEKLFDVICEIVEKYQIANILELGRFVRKYGSFYGLDNMRIVNKVITPKSGLMRIYFDGAYRARKNGIQEVDLNIDSDTREIL